VFCDGLILGHQTGISGKNQKEYVEIFAQKENENLS
jgi:hypothetical protein